MKIKVELEKLLDIKSNISLAKSAEKGSVIIPMALTRAEEILNEELRNGIERQDFKVQRNRNG